MSKEAKYWLNGSRMQNGWALLMVLMYPYRDYSQVEVYVLCTYSGLSDSIDSTLLSRAADKKSASSPCYEEEDGRSSDKLCSLCAFIFMSWLWVFIFVRWDHAHVF